METRPFTEEQASDETLCRMAAEGCRDAEEELALRYNRVVRKYARPLFLAGGDSEDLIQEGMLGLVSGIRSFKVENGAKFSSYAYSCISNRMKTAAAKLRGQQATENSSDEDIEPASTLTPESIIIQREILKELENTLSPLEKRCFLLHISGLSFEEIGEKVGISEKSAKNAAGRAGVKLRELISGSGE